MDLHINIFLSKKLNQVLKHFTQNSRQLGMITVLN